MLRVVIPGLYGIGAWWANEMSLPGGAAASAPLVPLTSVQLTQMLGALTDRVHLHENETVHLKRRLEEMPQISLS